MCDNEIDLDEKEKKLLLLWKLRIEIYGMLCSSLPEIATTRSFCDKLGNLRLKLIEVRLLIENELI